MTHAFRHWKQRHRVNVRHGRKKRTGQVRYLAVFNAVAVALDDPRVTPLQR